MQLKKLLNEKVDSNNKKYKIIKSMIIIFTFAVLVSFLFRKSIILNTHDAWIHIQRMIITEITMKEGELIPLISHRTYNGLGSAENVFYQPMTTYIPILIKTITNSYTVAINIFILLMFFISGISIYFLGKEITKNEIISLNAALLYMYLPYTIQNIYIRGAFGEFMALSFVPLVFLGLFNLFYGDGSKKKWIFIGAILLVLTHTITTLYTMIFSIIIVLLNIKKINKDIIKTLGLYMVFIIGISMFFIGPLIEFKMFTQYSIFSPKIMNMEGNIVAKKALKLKALFIDNSENGISFLIGIPLLILTCSIFIVLKKMRREFDKKQQKMYLILFAFLICCYFMMTKYFPWENMPGIIKIIQFPWRMMGYAGIFLSIICSINMFLIVESIFEKIIKDKNNKKEKIKRIIEIITIIITIIVCIYNTKTIKEFMNSENCKAKMKKHDISISDYNYMINNENKIIMKGTTFDYMPARAFIFEQQVALGKIEKRKEGSVKIKGNFNIIEDESDKLSRNIKLENVKKDDVIELSLFYFPGFEVIIKTQDKIVKEKYEESRIGHMQITFKEDYEKVDISVRYIGTFFEKECYFISLVTIILLVICIIEKRRKDEGKVKKI